MSHTANCEGCLEDTVDCWNCPFCEKPFCINTDDGGHECYFEHIGECEDNPGNLFSVFVDC